MTEEQKKCVLRFDHDMTTRMSCRGGDFLVWIGWRGIFSSPEQGVVIHDLWEMREGDFATITNREADFPQWFELHPTEVCNSLACKMMEKLNKGYVPRPKVQAPNLWRVQAGDRLAWIGTPRSGGAAHGHILSLVDFHESALVYAETNRKCTMEERYVFGALSDEGEKPHNADKCNEAVEFVRGMGAPRILVTDWKLG